MKIRSITFFLDPGWPLNTEVFERAGVFLKTAKPAFEKVGYEVQTARIATLPFPHILTDIESQAAVRFARDLEAAARDRGFDYVCLGPALPGKSESYDVIPEVLAKTENAFLSGMMTHNDEVSLPAVRACAQVINQAASLTKDGFTNLRFAALANVPPGSPFFPAAYHSGDVPEFRLATEAADLAVKAFGGAGSLEEARQSLIESIEDHARNLAGVGGELENRHGIKFGGLDFSLAPFPQEARSIGAAFERLGAPAVGLSGSLAAAAFITGTLDQAHFARAGFCGLFLPLLEDAVLAARAEQGLLSVTDLLLYSAVCGTGLDTIPLPGNVSTEQLESVLLDLAALAIRLDKPLTARLMPIPGKAAGDPTGFNFAYFANSRVLPLESRPLQGLLKSGESLRLSKRK